MRDVPLFHYTVLTITEHFVIGSLSLLGVENSKLEVDRSLQEENNNRTSIARNMRLVLQYHRNTTTECRFLLPLVLPTQVIPIGKETLQLKHRQLLQKMQKQFISRPTGRCQRFCKRLHRGLDPRYFPTFELPPGTIDIVRHRGDFTEVQLQVDK